MRPLFIWFLISFCFCAAYGQDPMEEKMGWNEMAKSKSSLFVHFDKNIYSNNETIWFTGYLLKANVNLNQHKVMAVALIRDLDSLVITEDKFPILNGITHGNLFIPDSVLTGNYHLVAFTNVLQNGFPNALYIQSITIKTNIDPAFKANMVISDKATTTNPNHEVLINVRAKDGRFLSKATTVQYQYGNINKTTKTNPTGSLILKLPDQDLLTDPNLYVSLKNDKKDSFISMPLPSAKDRAKVNFYTEGGNLISGLLNNVAWEVKDQQTNPLTIQAFLYRDQQCIDTLESNIYGIGKFSLMPVKGANYSVKLIHSGLADSTYYLPTILENGLTLQLPEAIVKDTLKLTLRSNIDKNIIIRIHDFRKSFLYVPFNMESSKRGIKIPLEQVPKGLVTITISDSLDRPLAERIFFAHYDNTEKLTIQTDKQQYAQRQKVELKLNLKDTEEKAIVSIACVQDNRLDYKKMDDINSYAYLNSELKDLPLHLKGNIYNDKAYLEDVLLVRGWRRYTWQDLQKIEVKDTIQQINSLRLTAKVTRLKKDLSKPITINAINEKMVTIIETNQKGIFDLDGKDKHLPAGKTTLLVINDPKKEAYDIQIKDDYSKTTNDLIQKAPFKRFFLSMVSANNADLVLKNSEKAIRLQEVVVKSSKNNSFIFERGDPGSNACGDYVCTYNILNCPNHIGDSGNTQPIPGRQYSSNGMSTVYQKCLLQEGKEYIYSFKGIHLAKEFYINDYKEPQEPAFFSTIYWNFSNFLTAGKENTLSFYTSDITGKFRIIIQGFSQKDVIYAEKFFEVK